MGEPAPFFLYSFPSGSTRPDPRKGKKMTDTIESTWGKFQNELQQQPKVVGCLVCGFRSENEIEIEDFQDNGCPNCTKETRSLFIESRLWFDKINGNTYFSNRVWVNGKIAFIMPFEYGYELQFLFRALSELKERGYTNTEKLWDLRDAQGIDVYYSETYGKKSEMFKGLN